MIYTVNIMQFLMFICLHDNRIVNKLLALTYFS